MTRKFIRTAEFDRKWADMGLNDSDLQRLEYEILVNPQAAPVIPGTGKLRKLRFAFEHRGKSGSSRVCYVDFVEKEVVYLITAYAKNEKDNLTKAECNAIKKAITTLESSL